jgi:hypothetical protein
MSDTIAVKCQWHMQLRHESLTSKGGFALRKPPFSECSPVSTLTFRAKQLFLFVVRFVGDRIRCNDWRNCAAAVAKELQPLQDRRYNCPALC